MEQLTDARIAAISALKHVRDDRDKQNVDRILDYLNRRQEAENAAAAAASVDSTAPSTTRPVAPDPDEVRTIQASSILSSVRGVLKHVDCGANGAKLTVASAAKTMQLLISDPGAITIRNQPGSSINLTCGPQTKAIQVAVEYLDKSDTKTGTLGEVRALEFLN